MHRYMHSNSSVVPTDMILFSIIIYQHPSSRTLQSLKMICAIVVVVVELLKKIPPSYEETKHRREKAVLKDRRSH